MARTPAGLPNGTRISDHVTLGVLTSTVPAGLIDAVLADTGRRSRRRRQLPARLVVYYVIALALYAQASYGEVLRCLLEGVRWLRSAGADPALADKSAITKARARLGAAPLKELFGRVARPLAGTDTPGAWYRGRRLVGLDGTTVDLPDAPALGQRFGRPPASRGASGFPQLRLLTLTETGTHAIFAATFGRYDARARSGWRRASSGGCARACCAWPTAPSSASSSGARRRPRAPTCSGGCGRTRSCLVASGCRTART